METKTPKFDCCPKCFWSDVSLKTWPDFESRKTGAKETQIQQIKQIKCETCTEESNFSEKWFCVKCKGQIDGHNHFFHGNMCDSCFYNEVNSEEIELFKKD